MFTIQKWNSLPPFPILQVLDKLVSLESIETKLWYWTFWVLRYYVYYRHMQCSSASSIIHTHVELPMTLLPFLLLSFLALQSCYWNSSSQWERMMSHVAMLPNHVLAVSVHMLSPFVVCRYHLWPCFRTLVLQPSWSRGHLQGRWATSTEECRLFNCYYIMKSMMWSFNSSSKNLKLYQLLFICSEDYANC